MERGVIDLLFCNFIHPLPIPNATYAKFLTSSDSLIILRIIQLTGRYSIRGIPQQSLISSQTSKLCV